MKTIEVTDEMYDSLMELSKEMTTQDMRCTRMPHMFQIKTTEQVAAYSGCGEDVWVDEEGNELNDDKEIREYVLQDISENDESVLHLDEKEAKDFAKGKVDEMDEDDLEEYLENNRHNWRKVEVTTEDKYQNTFFTAKACEAHIEANHYHYKDPKCYLNHAYRNPEMELVATFLCELSGGKLHT